MNWRQRLRRLRGEWVRWPPELLTVSYLPDGRPEGMTDTLMFSGLAGHGVYTKLRHLDPFGSEVREVPDGHGH